MIKKHKIQIKQFKKNMSLRLLTRAFVEFTLAILCFWILYSIGWFLCSLTIWQESDIFYFILNGIQDNVFLFLSIFCILTFFVILLRSWLRALGFLEEVLNATENIYNPKIDYIKLSTSLTEVEENMNQIKRNVLANQQALKEAEQRKNDLVVYLAHDLKTPLTSVIGYLSLLRDEQQISKELQEKYLNISLEKAQRLEDLINEFFEITRFNLSTISLELSQINLTRMLEQIIFEFHPLFAEKHLSCILDIVPDLPFVCDVDKMQRVFDNLLRNAVNYSFEDSIISIIVQKQSDCLIIQVSNRGFTIPKEKLNRIFEQFYRLDSARTTKNGGAGLGLAIAKEIVASHGGSISALSQEDEIQFKIILPLQESSVS